MTRIKIKHSRTAYLDGEALFKQYWQVMGTARSILGVRRWCIAQGILNPVMNTPPTAMGIEKAMYRWAIKHLDESFEIFNASLRDEGKFHTKKEWE